jgi:Branched-chain amino acid transport protein (AzlD)
MSGAEWHLFVLATVLAFLASDFWRWSSVLLSLNFREDDEIVVFARMVATAVLAGVVARILLFPPAELAAIPVWVRITAMAVGMSVFALRGKSVFAAIVSGQATLIGLGMLIG